MDSLAAEMQKVSLRQSSDVPVQPNSQSTGTKPTVSFVTARSDQDKSTVRQSVMGEARGHPYSSCELRGKKKKNKTEAEWKISIAI